MPIYTVIVDYAGGTYISQVSASRIDNVLAQWADDFDFVYLTKKRNPKKKSKILRRKKYVKKLIEAEDSPVLLRGLQNVWCTSFLIKKKSCLINIVSTTEN